MRHLILVRHAKSSWRFPELDDHDRPLNARGRRDAPRMSQRLVAALHRHQLRLESLLSSSAVRAHSYATEIAEATEQAAQAREALYTFSARSLIQFVSQLPNEHRCVALVGHNPAITHVANQLGSQPLDNVPTSAFVILACDIEQWTDIELRTHTCLEFDYPKKRR